MPTKQLPSRPDLTQLKHQAKDLMKARQAGDLAALQRIREFHPRFNKSRDAEIAGSEIYSGGCPAYYCPRIWICLMAKVESADNRSTTCRRIAAAAP